MGLLKWLFDKKKEWEEDDVDSWEEVVYERDNLDMTDPGERRKYVKECLNQMSDASREIDMLTGEYNLVTTYLTDIEEIERLPMAEISNLRELCKGMTMLTEEKVSYEGRKSRMSDTEYNSIDRKADEVEEGIRKMEEAEEYRALVKQDLRRLDSERHAYYFRRRDLENELANLKGMTMIILSAVAVCFVLLLVLQFGLEFDTKLGYVLAGAITAIVITVIYFKYSEADRELLQVCNAINRLVQLQNTVKIRYVNNTSLLEYLYVKYGVEGSSQLKKLWEKYQVEKEERRKFVRTQLELDYHQEELMHLLKRYKLSQPERWLNQTAAILDPREMVELRHELIQRRQSLRKQIEYNKEIAQSAKEEIMDLARSYPKYTKEIQDMVDGYEKIY